MRLHGAAVLALRHAAVYARSRRAVDWHAEDRAQTMLALRLSMREIARTRIRVRAAMATQAGEQGRHRGGRPPCANRLADARPAPEQAPCLLGVAGAPAGAGPPDTAPVLTWNVRPAAGRAQRRADH